MKLINDLVERINNPLCCEDLQVLLSAINKSHNKNINQKHWDTVVDALWRHLNVGFDNLDDQLFCGTCYFSALTHCTSQNEHYTNIVSKLRSYSINSKDTYISISLIYGMFQSSFMPQLYEEHDSVIDKIFIKSLDILISMGYKYSKYTFLTFKILSCLKKAIGTSLEGHLKNKDIQYRLLNLINHNWENPITGVRDMARTAFHTLITVLDDSVLTNVLNDLNGYHCVKRDCWIEGYYWNKAKYLMLSEIIEVIATTKKLLEMNGWVDGVIYSLSKPGLVSAGADMYFAILKKLNSPQEWISLFMKPVLSILCGNGTKTIDNFTNYWCLTTLKKFPSLFEELISENITFYSLFSIMTLGNKQGLLVKCWSDDQFTGKMKNALEDSNDYIRISAFSILCVSSKTASPIDLEYQLVLRFIENNINSDSTVLRIHMLNNLEQFLNRLHSNFLSDNSLNSDSLIKFCKNIQFIVIDSLNNPGNYQRKITSLKLCDLLFQNFSERPKRKHLPRTSSPLIDVLKHENSMDLYSEQVMLKLLLLMRDPADDVRDKVTHILLRHYKKYLISKDTFNDLTKSALNGIQCRFFFDINCGISMFKLLINILLKEDINGAQFCQVENIYQFAFNNFKSVHMSGSSVIETIEEGKQLHSFIAIMTATLEYSFKNQYKLRYLTLEVTNETLTILEKISKNFSHEDSNSDFNMIDCMIRDSIIKAGYKLNENGEDPHKTADIFQIVLNCTWLSVKESCVLAGQLLKYLGAEQQHYATCSRCLHILTNVLETSRHKGAMEAAGLALGQSVQHLTSLPTSNKASELPMRLLKQKLDELISDAMKTSSVTRRGAGLSILVHRIVSCDFRHGKPLFHYFMNRLLASCTSLTEPSAQESSAERDLPKAVHLHFLTRIITDSGLACDAMHYSAALAELAFTNLTSCHWQIRNAALQLYGALIPKLIGQNKQSGSENITIATVAIDELRTHSPELWRHILQQVEPDEESGEDVITTHSNLVPILNLLASCAKSYKFSFDTVTNIDCAFKPLCALLSSPIYTVRRLTSKCIYNLYPFHYIVENLMRAEVSSENELHGRLMIYEMLYKNYFQVYPREFVELELLYERLFTQNLSRSYLSRVIVEEVTNVGEGITLGQTFRELQDNSSSPGIYFWFQKRLARAVKSCNPTQLPHLLTSILHFGGESDTHLEVVFKNMDLISLDSHLLSQIIKVFLQYVGTPNGNHSHILLKNVYKISLIANVKIPDSFIDESFKYMSQIDYNSRYVMPLVAKGLLQRENIQLLHVLIDKIFEYSDFDRIDSDIRYAAMLANNELAYQLLSRTVPDEVIVKSVVAAVIFLQEEDSDIRYEAVNYYKNAMAQTLKLNPYICFRNVLDRRFLSKVFQNPKYITRVCDELEKLVNKYKLLAKAYQDDYNPFSNNMNNIYIELDNLHIHTKKLSETLS